MKKITNFCNFLEKKFDKNFKKNFFNNKRSLLNFKTLIK